MAASDIPAFRETLSDAAVYAPPGRPAAFAEAIRSALSEDARRRAEERGPAVVERFLRPNTSALLKLYRDSARERRL